MNPLAIIATIVFAALCSLLAAGPARAEKADRSKPMEISANEGSYDGQKDIQILNGNVVITQGTLRINAARGETRRDADGNLTGVVTGAPVAMRQKREGCDVFIEAYAERVEFDQGKDTIKLITKARLKNGSDELTGDTILYNSTTEFYQVMSDRPGAAGAGVIRMTIQPRASGTPDPCANKPGAAKGATAPK